MLFTVVNNNDRVYIYKLLEYSPHIKYLTDKSFYPIIIKYYPLFKIITINNKSYIFYIFKSLDHMNNIIKYVKENIVKNEIDECADAIKTINKMNPEIDDTDYITVSTRMSYAIQNLEKHTSGWRSPFEIHDINYVNNIFKIDILMYLKQIENIFGCQLCSTI